MEQLTSLGINVLDNERTRIRYNGTLQKLTDLFATGGGGISQQDLQQAIDDLVDGAPEALNTLNELAIAVAAKQDAITVPTPALSNEVSLLSNGTLRNLRITGAGVGTPVVLNDVLQISINYVTSQAFQQYRTDQIAALALKQDLLNNGNNAGEYLLNGSTLRRLAVSGAPLSVAVANDTITFSCDSPTNATFTTSVNAAHQAAVSAYTEAVSRQAALSSPSTGTAVFDGTSTIRSLSTSSPLSLSVAGDVITIGSSAYTSSQVDQLLTGKQGSLLVVGGSSGGHSLLDQTTLKRLALPGFTVSDTSTVLTASYDLATELANLGTYATNTDVSNALANHSLTTTQQNQIITQVYLRPVVDSYLADHQSQIDGKQPIIAATSEIAGEHIWTGGSAGIVRKLAVQSPLSIAAQQNYLEISCPSFIQPTGNESLQLDHATDGKYIKLRSNAGGSKLHFEFKGGSLDFSHVDSANTIARVFRFPNSATGNAVFENAVSAPSFNSTSDRSLKTDDAELDATIAGPVLDQVAPKTYRRTDTNEQRHGFIAQELEEALKIHPNLGHVVSEREEDDGSTLKQVDYSRLTVLLWSTVRDLRQRVAQLEAAASSA